MSIILSNIEDITDIIKEEKQNWVIDVLVALGVNKELLTDDSSNYLASIGLEIWNNTNDESIDILRNNKIVGQWKFPKLIRVKENGKLYYEIHLNNWALPFQKRR